MYVCEIYIPVHLACEPVNVRLEDVSVSVTNSHGVLQKSPAR